MNTKNNAITKPATRKILLQGLQIQASVGMLEHERQASQLLVVDAEFITDASQAIDDADINTVLDYRLLRESLIKDIGSNHTDLLETLVERCLLSIKANFPLVLSAKVRICKPQAFADCAAVCVEQEY